jgi:hypothetical protein
LCNPDFDAPDCDCDASGCNWVCDIIDSEVTDSDAIDSDSTDPETSDSDTIDSDASVSVVSVHHVFDSDDSDRDWSYETSVYDYEIPPGLCMRHFCEYLKASTEKDNYESLHMFVVSTVN